MPSAHQDNKLFHTTTGLVVWNEKVLYAMKCCVSAMHWFALLLLLNSATVVDNGYHNLHL